MARSRREKREIAYAVKVLRYVREHEARGEDMSRLAESVEKQSALLVRKHACFVCGTEQTHPESIRLWESDHRGSECRKKLAGVAS